MRFFLAEKCFKLIYPEYILGNFSKIWFEDHEFLQSYQKFNPPDPHSAERKFFLQNLIKLVVDLPGNTAECGVYLGASSYIICRSLQSKNKTHHIFDSFAGLSEPGHNDGKYWKKNDLSVNLKQVQTNLPFQLIKYHVGWIPDTFSEVDNEKFCLVHIDVDLYQPTLDSIRFFYPRMVPNGVIVCDDYGFFTCPGAKQAIDEFMQDKTEKVIGSPTGQCFIIKK